MFWGNTKILCFPYLNIIKIYKGNSTFKITNGSFKEKICFLTSENSFENVFLKIIVYTLIFILGIMHNCIKNFSESVTKFKSPLNSLSYIVSSGVGITYNNFSKLSSFTWFFNSTIHFIISCGFSLKLLKIIATLLIFFCSKINIYSGCFGLFSFDF